MHDIALFLNFLSLKMLFTYSHENHVLCLEVLICKKDATTLDAIMKHKEHFDQRLIDMVTDLNKTVKILVKKKQE